MKIPANPHFAIIIIIIKKTIKIIFKDDN